MNLADHARLEELKAECRRKIRLLEAQLETEASYLRYLEGHSV